LAMWLARSDLRAVADLFSEDVRERTCRFVACMLFSAWRRTVGWLASKYQVSAKKQCPYTHGKVKCSIINHHSWMLILRYHMCFASAVDNNQATCLHTMRRRTRCEFFQIM
jgi:hypothetical protein